MWGVICTTLTFDSVVLGGWRAMDARLAFELPLKMALVFHLEHLYRGHRINLVQFYSNSCGSMSAVPGPFFAGLEKRTACAGTLTPVFFLAMSAPHRLPTGHIGRFVEAVNHPTDATIRQMTQIGGPSSRRHHDRPGPHITHMMAEEHLPHRRHAEQRLHSPEQQRPDSPERHLTPERSVSPERPPTPEDGRPAAAQPPVFARTPPALTIDREEAIAHVALVFPDIVSHQKYQLVGLDDLPRPQAYQDLPAGIDATIDMRRSKHELQLARKGVTYTEVLNTIDQWVLTVEDKESPKTKSARLKIAADYMVMVTGALPDWPQAKDSAWEVQVVRTFAPKFLHYLVIITPPRLGKTVIKSRSLLTMSIIFIHCIVRFTRDPKDAHRKAGLELLQDFDLYHTIRNQVSQLVKDYRLDRHYDDRQFYGRAEVSMMFEASMNTEGSTRVVKFGNNVRVGMGYYMALRPSTMGPYCKEYAQLGYFIKLRHLKIVNRGYYDWKFVIRTDNYKHNNDVVGTMQEWIIDMVTKGHNIHLCLGMWLILFLFSRNAFAKKYKTLEELATDPSSQIEIDPAMLDEPLFPAVAPGGRKFAEPMRPASANSISQTIGNLAKLAGLATAGGYALRRDTGNFYGDTMHKGIAQDVLHHKADGPYRGSYSKNMLNIPVVPLRLGEITTPDGRILPPVKHPYLSVAVQALIRIKHKAPSDEPEAKKIAKKAAKKEVHEVVEEAADIQALHAEEDELWTDYRACFTEGHHHYPKNATENITRIFAVMDGTADVPKLLAKKYKGIYLVEGVVIEEVIKIKDKLKETSAKLVALRKRSRRKEEESRQRELTNDIRSGRLAGTVEETDAAVALSTAPSHMVTSTTSAVKKAQRSAASDTAAPPTTSTAAPPATSTAALPTTSTAVPSASQPSSSTSALPASPAHQAEDYDPDDHGDWDDPEFSEKFMTFIHNTCKSSDPKLTEAELMEPPIDTVDGTDVDESLEKDSLEVPVVFLRRHLMERLLEPIVLERQFAEHRTDAGWNCPRCPLFQRKKKSATFTTQSGLKKHLFGSHSPWQDIELQMYIPGGGWLFQCPSHDYKAASILLIREHMRSKGCKSSKQYIGMYKAHILDQDVLQKTDRAAELDDDSDTDDGGEEAPAPTRGQPKRYFRGHDKLKVPDVLDITRVSLAKGKSTMDETAYETLLEILQEIENCE